MRKAQVETFGLMIIVVMLIVIVLIALRFMLINNNSTSNNEILSIKANSIANSIKNADLCNGNFEKAIVACCNNENFCDQNACELVSKEIKSILSSIDESSYVEAVNYKKSKCFSVGNCINGIVSNSYVLNNDVEFKVRLCSK